VLRNKNTLFRSYRSRDDSGFDWPEFKAYLLNLGISLSEHID